jgi:hypothetical protein
MQLEGRVLGLGVLTQSSEGSLDEAGLAPHRFVDQRMRRPRQAANFRRDDGLISFSGNARQFAWRRGVQDRLSWMIQLAAIAAAEPARVDSGASVTLLVVGARGDAAPWVFRSLGSEPLETNAGTIAAVHLRREPRGAHDTSVDVWLDPAQHHLPVRATLRSGADDDALDLRLRSLEP